MANRGFADIGRVYTPDTLAQHLQGTDLRRWAGVTVHHTFFPDLGMRPKGFTVQHIENIKWGYTEGRRRKGHKPWSAGPHLFVDEDQIFGMTPLDHPGVHAVSFNADRIGIELLGNYDRRNEVESTRGRRVIRNAVLACSVILDALKAQGAFAPSLNRHCDDPKTNKTCPGAEFPWGQFTHDVQAAREDRGDDSLLDVSEVARELEKRIENIEWQLAQLRKMHERISG